VGASSSTRLEHRTHNPQVQGSNPWRPTKPHCAAPSVDGLIPPRGKSVAGLDEFTVALDHAGIPAVEGDQPVATGIRCRNAKFACLNLYPRRAESALVSEKSKNKKGAAGPLSGNGLCVSSLASRVYQMKRIASWIMRGVTVAAGAPKPLKFRPAPWVAR
jgi:hypothetical protein